MLKPSSIAVVAGAFGAVLLVAFLKGSVLGVAWSLAHPLLANLSVRQVARLPMKELADHSGGWVSIGIRERLNMVYIEACRSGNLTNLPDIGIRDRTATIPAV